LGCRCGLNSRKAIRAGRCGRGLCGEMAGDAGRASCIGVSLDAPSVADGHESFRQVPDRRYATRTPSGTTKFGWCCTRWFLLISVISAHFPAGSVEARRRTVGRHFRP
jgi:hypothetical protein